ncbi:MAG: 3D domain-containing protein [Phycisphaerales bacterium]
MTGDALLNATVGLACCCPRKLSHQSPETHALESRPTPRYSHERRRRLHRAMVLRRRLRMRRAGLVAGSLLTLTISLGAVMLMTHVLGTTPAAPLFVMDDGSTHQAVEQAAAQLQSPPVAPSAPVESAPDIATTLPMPRLTPRPMRTFPVKYFGRRAVRPVRTMRMLVTAYCPGPCCCGEFADGITASGKSVFTNAGRLVAADTRVLPFHSLLTIPGYDHANVVPVLDRGGKIKGRRLDVLFPTHAQAKQWGVKWVDVTVWEYVD